MNVFEAVIQGAVQGLTEFLPVSSSGHLSLSQHVLGVQSNNLFFDVMLHLGTLLAVFAVYYKLIFRLIGAFFSIIGEVFTGKFSWRRMNNDKRMVIMIIIGLLPLFCLFLPVPGTGMSIKDVTSKWSEEGNILVVGIALIATSVLLAIGIFLSKRNTVVHMAGKHSKVTYGKKSLNTIDAISVGFAQFVAAAVPGLSRSGSTLSVGLMKGIDKQAALDYSFILGMPAIIAAGLLEFKEAMELPGFSIDVLPVVVGVIVSAVVGFLAIKLFKWLLATDKMSIFVWYTLIVGSATIIISIIEHKTGVNLFTGAAL